MTNKLDNLFERILSETETDNGTPVDRAALYAAITHAQTPGTQSGDATERLAAHLDGALGSDEAALFDASLADAPDEVYELEAAQAFVDAMDAHREVAPADLVAAAAANVARPAPRRAARRGWFLNSASWGRQFAWAGGAAATVLLGVIVIDRADEIVHDPTVAVVPAQPTVDGGVPPPVAPVTTSLPAMPMPSVTVVPLPPAVGARPQQAPRAGGPRGTDAPSFKIENKALADAVNAAQQAAKAGNFAEAIAKAKEADAMAGKPPQLGPLLHGQIIAWAQQSKNYPEAIATIDKMLADKEGVRDELLAQGWSLATQAGDSAKRDAYTQELGNTLTPAARLAMASPMSKLRGENEVRGARGPSSNQNAMVSSPPPPSAALPAPAARGQEVPESVLITGSLVQGSASVGVPVTNLRPQDFAQTGQLQAQGLFKAPPQALGLTPPPAALAAPSVRADRLAQAPAAEAYRYGAAPAAPAYAPYAFPQNTERYPGARPNAVKLVSQEPVSTFSLDVDTASYANVRRYLTQGTLPPVDAVRVEEMVNYFDYAYMVPRDRDAPFLPSVVVYPSPWNADTQILHVGIKGYDLPRSERPKANLVFLIDTSGSMNSADKLPLVKRSFELLVEQLKADDHVSIVVYAGSAGMVLPPTPGWDKDRILASLDRLQAGGSTAGGEGIRQAYDLAKANFDRNGVNRVILATDGDFNVGITDPNALEAFVARERSSGVFLSVLGYGGGNYNDLLMQKLSQAGNGTAAYIDTANEARKVLVDEMNSTLFTIAKDVKVQIEFNPERVAEYRLIGYETRMLNQTDFNNDRVDAGDVGSGHTVTALYEITPVGSRAQMTDPLRYGGRRDVRPAQSEIAFVKVRYKLPNEDESKLIERPVVNNDVVSDFNRLPIDYRFAAAVAGSAQLLRHDPYIKSFDYGRAIEIAQGARGDDEFGYRNEFVQLLLKAQSAASLQDLGRSLPRARD